MFPLRDENPTVRNPVATMVLIAANACCWMLLQGFGTTPTLAESFCYYALIPGDLLGHVFPGNAIRVSETRACVFDGTANPSTPISSMFMHGGWFHILGNMWFLWVFGDNVEDAMGPFRFVVFYILCGLAAAFAQFATDPASPRAHGWRVRRHRRCHGRICPTLSPGPRAHVRLPRLLRDHDRGPRRIHARLLVPGPTRERTAALGQSGGVAFWAHIGGFAAGLALVLLFRRPEHLAAHRAQGERRVSRHRWM